MAIDIYRKNLILRRGLLALLVLVLAIFQNTEGFFPQIFGIRALPLIPAVVCISMFERDIAGMFYGLFAGALWDMYSQGGDFNALYLLAAGFICGTLMNTVMRNNIVTAAILSSLFVTVHPIVYWAVHYAFANSGNAAFMLWRYYLPSIVYTALLIPIMFIIVRAIEKRFAHEE